MANQSPTDQNPWVEAQERYLQTVRESQEAITEALSTWSQSLSQVGPEQGLPIGDLYTRFEQTIDQMFNFFQQLLDHNREFVRSVLQATRPLAERASEQAEAASGAQQRGGGQEAQQRGGGQEAQQRGGGQEAQQRGGGQQS